jgi:hypothetical protein
MATPRAALADPPDGLVSFVQQAARLDQGSGVIIVPIQAQNLSKSLLQHVWFECPALDASGNLVDQGIAEVGNLHAGERGFVFVLMSGLTSSNYNIKCRISDVTK